MSSSSSSDSSIAGGRSLSLSVSTQKDFVINRDTGYRVVVAVTQATGMDANIFRYSYQPPAAGNAASVRYDGVCSPSDMEEFPAGDPDPDAFPAWCRRDSVDLVFRSTREAEETIAVIKEEAQTLVDSLNRSDTLVVSEVVVIS